MRVGPVISLVLSTALGVSAIFVGRTWLTGDADAASSPSAEQAAPQLVKVATPLSVIEPGQPLDLALLTTMDWPADLVPEGAVQDINTLQIGDDGQFYTLGAIVPGEPLLRAKLSLQPNFRKLSSIVQEGYRAMAIEVTDVTGVSGFVLPNDRVDILWTDLTELDDGKTLAESKVVLQNVRVLGIDQTFNQNLEGGRLSRTVAIEVSHEQSAQMASHTQVGVLTLSLRAEDDEAVVEVAAEKPAVRRPRPAPRPVALRRAPEPPKEATVRLIQGETSQTVKTPIAPPRFDTVIAEQEK